MFSHVTIYLEPPILVEGGAIIVAGRPIPDDEWRSIPQTRNLASGDAENPKRDQVQASDRLFGAVIRSPVSIVELAYPENGSYTFNIMAAPPYRAEYEARLRTQEVLVGSADMVPDPEGGYVDWPSMTVIAVQGTLRSTSFARLANATFSNALSEASPVETFEGLRVISLTPDQIERSVRE